MTKEEFAKKNNYHCIKRCCEHCVCYYPLYGSGDRGNCLHPDRKNDPFEVRSYGTCKAIKLREGYK